MVRQIVPVPSPGPIHFNKQLPLPPVVNSIPSTNSAQIKQLLNSFPQHIPPHQSVTPKSISTVSAPTQQSIVTYSTTATPIYNNVAPSKVNNNNHALFYGTNGDPTSIYSQPGAIHYGTHLYHPNINNKIPPFGISVGGGIRKFK